MMKIQEAVLDLALNHGVINRTLSAHAILAHTMPTVMANWQPDEIESANAFLEGLPEHEYDRFTTGKFPRATSPGGGIAQKMLEIAFDNFPYPFGNQA